MYLTATFSFVLVIFVPGTHSYNKVRPIDNISLYKINRSGKIKFVSFKNNMFYIFKHFLSDNLSYIYIERKVHKIVLYPTFYCCNAFRHLG